MMQFLLLSMMLTSTFALVLCDQSQLAHVQKICEAKGRRLLQESGGMDAVNMQDRMICACSDLIPVEQRNCYVDERATMTLQEEYVAHCSNLDAQEALEKQVGFISALFGSCTDPAKAHCKDIESSTGCADHWVTHKQEYRDACGWWWSNPCDRCCEPDKNIVDTGEAGGRGGKCMCPDGFEFNVGTAENCDGGTLSAATRYSSQKVTCRKYVKQLVPQNEVIVTGCGSGDSICSFEYNLDRTLGASAQAELENSVERNSDDEDEEEEEKTTMTTTKSANDDDDDGIDWSASVMVGATFSAGASTRVRAQLKGSVIFGPNQSLDDLKLRMELNNMGFDMDSKIVMGLSAGAEISAAKKIKLGPKLPVGPTTITIPTQVGPIPIMVSMNVQPVARLSVSGEVAASGTFTIENVYHVSYSDMFIELDLINFQASQNLDSITATSAYSDMYTLLLTGSLGFSITAHIGVEVDFMLYETVGVSLAPAMELKLSASGEASYLKRWSSSTSLPPAAVSHACSATACIGGYVDAGLAWIGDDLGEAAAAVREKMGSHRRQLAPLSFATKMQRACHDEMQCTMGMFANMLAGVCDIDVSSMFDLTLQAPDLSALDPPTMTMPIGEVCYTVGQQDGEFFHRAGGADEVACASGTAMTCAGCRTQANCGGDCAWKNSACLPADQDYSMSPGGKCGAGFEPITTSWQDCKTAAESLGYEGDAVAHVSTSGSFGTSRPQGCFITGENNRVRYNTNNGIAHGARFAGGDAIICVAGVEAEQAVGWLSFDIVDYSSENGPRDVLITGFALVGIFAIIAYVYQKTFKKKYETIPSPEVEEI